MWTVQPHPLPEVQRGWATCPSSHSCSFQWPCLCGPQAEGPWFLLGAPMLGGKAVPFHPGAGVYTGIHNSRGNGQSSPGMEGSPGKAGSGRVRGSGGRRQGNAGPWAERGQGALWAWFRPCRVQGGLYLLRDYPLLYCPERVIPRVGGGHRVSKLQPRAKRTSLLTPHPVLQVEEHLGASTAWRMQVGVGAPFS